MSTTLSLTYENLGLGYVAVVDGTVAYVASTYGRDQVMPPYSKPGGGHPTASLTPNGIRSVGRKIEAAGLAAWIGKRRAEAEKAAEIQDSIERQYAARGW